MGRRKGGKRQSPLARPSIHDTLRTLSARSETSSNKKKKKTLELLNEILFAAGRLLPSASLRLAFASHPQELMNFSDVARNGRLMMFLLRSTHASSSKLISCWSTYHPNSGGSMPPTPTSTSRSRSCIYHVNDDILFTALHKVIMHHDQL